MSCIITQIDALLEFNNIIKDYNYYTVEPNSVSTNSTYIGITDSSSSNIAGCVGIRKNTVKHLRVKKIFRQLGYGTKLLYHAETIIKMRGYKSAVTYVHFQNEKALNFFNKNKYSLITCLDYYYILKKSLI